MKKIKRVILTFFTVFMLFSIVSVSVQAATISTTSKKYGYMAPTDAKIKKTVKTVIQKPGSVGSRLFWLRYGK